MEKEVAFYEEMFLSLLDRGVTVREAMIQTCGQLFLTEFVPARMKNGGRMDQNMVQFVTRLSEKWKSIVEAIGPMADGSKLDPALFEGCVLKNLAPDAEYYCRYWRWCKKEGRELGKSSLFLFKKKGNYPFVPMAKAS
jgi:hypothetical protein